jgi:hypothetical protein
LLVVRGPNHFHLAGAQRALLGDTGLLLGEPLGDGLCRLDLLGGCARRRVFVRKVRIPVVLAHRDRGGIGRASSQAGARGHRFGYGFLTLGDQLVAQLFELLEFEEVQGAVAQRGVVSSAKELEGFGPALDLLGKGIHELGPLFVVFSLDGESEELGASLARLELVQRAHTGCVAWQERGEVGVDLDLSPPRADQTGADEDEEQTQQRRAATRGDRLDQPSRGSHQPVHVAIVLRPARPCHRGSPIRSAFFDHLGQEGQENRVEPTASALTQTSRPRCASKVQSHGLESVHPAGAKERNPSGAR